MPVRVVPGKLTQEASLVAVQEHPAGSFTDISPVVPDLGIATRVGVTTGRHGTPLCFTVTALPPMRMFALREVPATFAAIFNVTDELPFALAFDAVTHVGRPVTDQTQVEAVVTLTVTELDVALTETLVGDRV